MDIWGGWGYHIYTVFMVFLWFSSVAVYGFRAPRGGSTEVPKGNRYNCTAIPHWSIQQFSEKAILCSIRVPSLLGEWLPSNAWDLRSAPSANCWHKCPPVKYRKATWSIEDKGRKKGAQPLHSFLKETRTFGQPVGSPATDWRSFPILRGRLWAPPLPEVWLHDPAIHDDLQQICMATKKAEWQKSSGFGHSTGSSSWTLQTSVCVYIYIYTHTLSGRYTH